MAGNRINRSRPSLSQTVASWQWLITALLGLGAALVPGRRPGHQGSAIPARTVLRAWALLMERTIAGGPEGRWGVRISAGSITSQTSVVLWRIKVWGKSPTT